MRTVVALLLSLSSLLAGAGCTGGLHLHFGEGCKIQVGPETWPSHEATHSQPSSDASEKLDTPSEIILDALRGINNEDFRSENR